MEKDNQQQIQYVMNSKGTATSVIVPIELWHALASEKETRHLLGSSMMKKRLRAARKRTTSVIFDVVHKKLGF
jgi:hypothetical protein